MAKKVEVFHINLRKAINACKKLTDNLKNTKNAIVSVNENRLNVASIDTFNAPLYIKSTNRMTRASIYIKGNDYKGTLISQLSTPDVAVADITGNGINFVIISAYLPPNEDYERALNELQHAINNIDKDKNILICSDTNSRSTYWNDKITNKRGEMFEDFAITNDLTVLNTDHPITFSNTKNETSKIDLILGNYKILDYRPYIETLSNTYTASDHKMIKIELEIGHHKSNNPFRSTTRKYRTNKADWVTFNKNLDSYDHIINLTNFEVDNEEEADLAVNRINQYLDLVCETSIPKLKHNSKRNPNQNDEIDKLTGLEQNLFSRHNRLKDTNKFEALKVMKELTEVQKQMTTALIKHRKKCWENECTTKDINKAYSIHKKCKLKLNRSCPSTIKDLNGNITKNSHETTEKLFEHSFPDKKHPKLQEKISNDETNTFTPITIQEVSQIINWMANDKAPGVDGFTPQIIKKALHKILLPMTKLYNSLLRIQYFPDIWKEGFAIFIPKPNAEEKTKTVKDFRPITLLNVLGKVFEKLVINRINKYLYSNNKMNNRQDGFNKQRSTIHSLHTFRNFIMKNKQRNCSTVAVFLDISGAFDNACWQLIIESLKRNDCPIYLTNLIISYFQNRKVTTNSHNSKLEKDLNQGCPQGSCCGPSLWNILLNNIFDIEKIKEKLNCVDFYIKAFADDIALAFAINNNLKSITKLEKTIEATLDAIYEWGEKYYLNFNVKKTKAILFRSSAYVRTPKIIMNKQEIKVDRSAKYLGIWFDENLSFIEHAEKTLDKCKTIFNITRSYCGKTWGLDPYLTRLIYKTIITPVLTYGASIWYPVFIHKPISIKIRTFHYNCCKNIIKAYRTISIVSARILSNTLPLEFEIYMRAQVELSRITGAVSPDVLNNKLFDKKSYKPQYYYESLLNLFDGENDTIVLNDTENIKFGNPEDFIIEPRIKWANLPVGPDKIPISTIEDYLNTETDYYIFTDGSHRPDYGTGCGIVIKNTTEDLVSLSIPLNPLCSNFQAEMFAIYKSLKWAHDNLALNNKTIIICTDSLGAILKLKNTFSDSFLPFLINEYLKKSIEINCQIKFAKIKAHTGVEGNEKSDSLAKQASFNSMNYKSQITVHNQSSVSTYTVNNTEPEYNYLPISCVKRNIKKQCTLAWLESAYDKEFIDDRAKLNDWILNIIPNKKLVTKKLVNLCDYYTTQVLTGHGGFMQYFKRFEISECDKCITCKDQIDSPEHVLFKCNKKYMEILNNIDIYEPKDLYKILNSNDNINAFKDLCKLIITERDSLISKALKPKEQKSKVNKKLKNVKTEKKESIKLSNVNSKPTRKIGKANVDPKVKETKFTYKIDRNQWLTDDHLSNFSLKIQKQLKCTKYLIIPPLMYEHNNHLISYLNNNLRNENEYILAIINQNGNHWILGLIKKKKKIISILDSYRQVNHQENFKKLVMIADLSLTHMHINSNLNQFKFNCTLDSPKQKNENDCGVFVCRFIKNILEKNDRNFSILTGQYRDEIEKVLNNNTIINENRSRSTSSTINDKYNHSNYLNSIETLTIAIEFINYPQLIRNYF